jgi:hypothetical protein
MITYGPDNQEQIRQMLRDYLQNPHQFYQDVFEAAKDGGVSRPGKELADVLDIAESSANRFARQRETDEAPTATGARSDLERMILTIKHFAIPHDIQSVQTLISALQQLIDDEIEHRADQYLSETEHLREIVMKENHDVVVAIGANKPSCELMRELSESSVANKILLAVRRKQEMLARKKSA